MTYIPYLGTFFFSRYPSVALARNSPLMNGGVGVLRWPCLNASVRW